MVDCITATSFRTPSCSACTSARHTVSVFPGRSTCPRRHKLLSHGRRHQVDFEFHSKHLNTRRCQRERRIPTRTIRYGRDRRRMEKPMLLRKSLVKPHHNHHLPRLNRFECRPQRLHQALPRKTIPDTGCKVGIARGKFRHQRRDWLETNNRKHS